MSIGKLEGYSIPAFGGKVSKDIAHTYVVASNGNRWGCFGTATGGDHLEQGIGDLVVAEKIAGFRSWAGLVYGITGVCHQASNRILSPSEVTVRRAGGYFLSVSSFGEYGVGDVSWSKRQAKSGQSFSSTYNSGTSSLLNSLERHQHNLHTYQMNPQASLEAVSYDPQDRRKEKIFGKIARKWQLVAIESAIDYVKGNMGIMQYANSINDEATQFIHSTVGILGHSATERIMNMEFTEETKFKLIESSKMDVQN